MNASPRPVTGRRRVMLAGLALTAPWAVVACGGETTQVVPPPVEVFVASGDSQYGTAGQTLQTPLRVLVRALTTQLPQSGVEVLWSVESGDASIASVAGTISDSIGLARATVRFGSSLGEVVVRATAQGQSPATADFRLFLVDTPVLSGLSATSAVPGASITLTGSNFIPDPAQNVVLFAGIRGTVTAATATQLTVTVPACLPARTVPVTVRFGAVSSGSIDLSVDAGGTVRTMAVGEVVDAFDAAGATCVTVPGSGAAKYVVAVHSTASVGAASHPWVLRGLGEQTIAVPQAKAASAAFDDEGDFGAMWDRHLRAREEELSLERRRRSATEGLAAVEAGPQPVPQVDDVRDFRVYRNPGDFVDVTAVARYVGQRAALFVDLDAPTGGFAVADLQAFSDLFDQAIEPTVTGAYGAASDLDSNDRIVILFTPVVNALTPRGSNGFVAGFFFGLDLLPESEGSNGGEIFYALVPDPAAQFSDARSKEAVLSLTPAVLAHEFQHMVNFNERVLVRGAEANETVWLSEALAQYAEELVARDFEALGDDTSTQLFRAGVRDRARRYLSGPRDISLVISSGNGSLAERGAGYLYLAYLTDRFGRDLPGRLTRTTRTGVANVEAETTAQWEETLSDWWAAVVLDGPAPEQGDHVYADTDLRAFIGDPWPLIPEDVGGADFVRSGTMRSASVAYYIVDPADLGTMTLRLGGQGGGSSAPQAGLRMRIIRVE